MAINSQFNKESKKGLEEIDEDFTGVQRKKFTCRKCGYKFTVNMEKYHVSCPWCSAKNEV